MLRHAILMFETSIIFNGYLIAAEHLAWIWDRQDLHTVKMERASEREHFPCHIHMCHTLFMRSFSKRKAFTFPTAGTGIRTRMLKSADGQDMQLRLEVSIIKTDRCLHKKLRIYLYLCVLKPKPGIIFILLHLATTRLMNE